MVWAIALSLAWLLPNHYAPWSSFHMDAWSALVLSVAAMAVIVRSPAPMAWHGPAVLVTCVIGILWLQYGFGLIPMVGTAWINSVYLLGLLLALLVGARWESISPGQLVDGLFTAIVFAALVSVGLQLHQWLMLDGLEIWSMGQGFGRPFANFGQPNQLATLLLWSLLGIAWGVVRKRVGVGTATFCAVYLLFGLALTASRTAWVAVVLLTCASWVWRPLNRYRRVPHLVTALAAIFAAFVMSSGWMSQVLLIASTEVGEIARMGTEMRPVVWTMFLDAALQQPFWGYGWGPLSVAQLGVAIDHPTMQTVYSHSHNLFLDLVLWCGIPIGLAISLYLLWWLGTSIAQINHAEDALLVLFLLVVANHAMLELPLHYAYFLLPVGMIMGALDTRLRRRPVGLTVRWVPAAVWVCSVLLLALIIRDYSRIEPRYQALRFEWAGLKGRSMADPPDVLLLNQWQGFFWYVRMEPSEGMNASELGLMQSLTQLYPSAGFSQKLATALALNDQPDEARLWLKRACKVASASQCSALMGSWTNQAMGNPKIAGVRWPE